MSGSAPSARAASVTTLLGRAAGGDRAATSELARVVYDELRELARGRIGELAAGQTLQATDLVHEAWMKLAGFRAPGFEDRAHFFGAAANAMRNVIVDRARRRAALKRAAPGAAVPADEDEPEVMVPDVPPEDVLALHEALERLEREHERPARVVLLHFFGGLTLPEAAEIAGISLATAERDWRFARSWLQREMGTQAS
jgi:RNA polymerase sigma factor (TIGR02999 family)